MKNKNLKRSSYLSARDIRLAIRPVKIWGYGKSENFVCRVEINAAGIAVFTGVKGGQKLCNDSWEKFVKRLKEKQRRSDKFMWKPDESHGY
jgi:hypothetical protein